MLRISPIGCRFLRSWSAASCAWRRSRRRRSKRGRKRAASASRRHTKPNSPREAQQKRTGKKPRGRPPQPPTGGIDAKDQVNLTDEDSRIMKAAGGER